MYFKIPCFPINAKKDTKNIIKGGKNKQKFKTKPCRMMCDRQSEGKVIALILRCSNFIPRSPTLLAQVNMLGQTDQCVQQ